MTQSGTEHTRVPNFDLSRFVDAFEWTLTAPPRARAYYRWLASGEPAEGVPDLFTELDLEMLNGLDTVQLPNGHFTDIAETAFDHPNGARWVHRVVRWGEQAVGYAARQWRPTGSVSGVLTIAWAGSPHLEVWIDLPDVPRTPEAAAALLERLTTRLAAPHRR